MARNLRAINIFGSKVMKAKKYPPPKFDTIVEPFAGGAGYSLLHHERQVILSDADPNITKVWRYLIDTDPEEILELPLIAPGQDISDLRCSSGGRLLISWCLNQLGRPTRKLSSWGVYHLERGAACYWGPARRKQASVIAGRVKHWRISQHTYWLTPPMERCTWFIDPPYFGPDNPYAYRNINYENLTRWCRSLTGQVIVCEREGATWLPFRPLYEAPTQKRFGKRPRCREAVWIGGECG